MKLSITFNVVILLERKSYCEYFSKRGLEKSLCIAANVAAGYILHIHTPLQKELKMWMKKLIFKICKKRMYITKENAKASNYYNAQQSQN